MRVIDAGVTAKDASGKKNSRIGSMPAITISKADPRRAVRLGDVGIDRVGVTLGQREPATNGSSKATPTR